MLKADLPKPKLSKQLKDSQGEMYGGGYERTGSKQDGADHFTEGLFATNGQKHM